MKHTNWIRIFVLVLMLGIFLSACSNADRNNYQVYMDSDNLASSGGTLSSGVSTYTFTREKETTVPEQTTITVTLDGEPITLHYKSSAIAYNNVEIYRFESEDEKYSFNYFAHNMQLRSIKLYNMNMSVFADMTQGEMDTWLQEFVGQFSAENWGSYQPSYRTQYENTSGRHLKVKEFLEVLPEGFILDSRELIYTKTYGGLNTADVIHARFYFSDYGLENTVSILFNPNWFDSYTADVDVEKMQSAITEYVKANLWEGSTLESIAFEEGQLDYMDGNFVCRWLVKTEIITSKGLKDEDEYYILVDVPDA